MRGAEEAGMARGWYLRGWSWSQPALSRPRQKKFHATCPASPHLAHSTDNPAPSKPPLRSVGLVVFIFAASPAALTWGEISMSRALPEPWRVKVVEEIQLLPRDERERLLVKGGFSLFQIPSEAVFIDLFTDSGTPATSHWHWAGML